jgi:hypothetical protein
MWYSQFVEKRMLTKEEQMDRKTTCKKNDSAEKKEAVHGHGIEPRGKHSQCFTGCRNNIRKERLRK